MKKLSVLFAAVMMFLAVGVAKAQKIATMDVAAVLNAMPEKKKADDQLTAFTNAKQAEIKKQADAAQALYEKYEKEAASQTAETNKARGAEMQKLGEDLQKKRDAAMQEFNTKQDAAYASIEKKFYDAVNKVAKANGWDYIMDANSTAFVIKNGPDATPLVKKELGL